MKHRLICKRVREKRRAPSLITCGSLRGRKERQSIKTDRRTTIAAGEQRRLSVRRSRSRSSHGRRSFWRRGRGGRTIYLPGCLPRCVACIALGGIGLNHIFMTDCRKGLNERDCCSSSVGLRRLERVLPSRLNGISEYQTTNLLGVAFKLSFLQLP